VHRIREDHECLKETKRGVAQSKSPGANEQKFAVFLLLAWLIEIGELGLFGGDHAFVRMHLVVEFEGVVDVGEVLLGLSLDLRVGLNPVEKSRMLPRIVSSCTAGWNDSG